MYTVKTTEHTVASYWSSDFTLKFLTVWLFFYQTRCWIVIYFTYALLMKKMLKLYHQKLELSYFFLFYYSIKSTYLTYNHSNNKEIKIFPKHEYFMCQMVIIGKFYENVILLYKLRFCMIHTYNVKIMKQNWIVQTYKMNIK
jgi:hypothetical protein